MKISTLLESMNPEAQTYKILKHMNERGGITSFDAFVEYGITRLASRICDLKNLGVDIGHEDIRRGNKNWRRYYLKEQQ